MPGGGPCGIARNVLQCEVQIVFGMGVTVYVRLDLDHLVLPLGSESNYINLSVVWPATARMAARRSFLLLHRQGGEMTERFKNDQSFHEYTTEVKNMTEKKQPLKKIRFGAICATIWRDTYSDPKGHSFEVDSVVLDRTYKDRKGDWQHTGSMKKEDLLKAALALQKAYEFLAGPETEEVSTTEENGEENAELEVEVEQVR